MIHDLKPYPEYKDSGVEWLGQVPAHWEVERLKSCVRNVIDQTTVRREDDLYVALEHVESWTGRLRTASDDAAFDSQVKRFRAGDVLFGKLRPYLAKVARPNADGVCVGEFLVLRPCGQDVSAAYLENLIRSKPIIEVVNSSTFGAKMPRADWHFVGGIRVPIPPHPEQRAIVRFLDYVDGRVRRVIRARQRLVGLLEEYKQALIHQAVTGRIDVRTGQPYPEYKPSGVQWLGQVPAHWEVRRLKSLVQRIDQGVSPQAENYLAEHNAWGVLKAGCVNDGFFREEQHKRLPATFLIDPNLQVLEGDVLISRASGSPRLVGSVARVKSLSFRLLLSDKTFRPRFHSIVDPDFMVYSMNSRMYRNQVEQAISGAEGLANNLPLASLRSFVFTIPNVKEQTAIVEYLDAQTGKINRAIDAARREIELLKEFRTRLIADVVTGKLDVRGVKFEGGSVR